MKRKAYTANGSDSTEDCKRHLARSSAIHIYGSSAIYQPANGWQGTHYGGPVSETVKDGSGRHDRHTVSEHFLHGPKHNYTACRYAERLNIE